jgi:hypothetical protein
VKYLNEPNLDKQYSLRAQLIYNSSILERCGMANEGDFVESKMAGSLKFQNI